tara:strand:- start:201 stop:416 length:216 start_codon:yes stop_codon:yes gene_type:complete
MSEARGRKADDSAEKGLSKDQKASLIAGGLTAALALGSGAVMIPEILKEQRRNKMRRRTGSDIKPIKPDNL